jgi:hypothetical protein
VKRGLLQAILFVLMIPALIHAQRATKPQANQPVRFDLPADRTVNGFTYSLDGALSYRGKAFKPGVKADSRYVPSLNIFLWQSKGLAGVIVNDGLSPNSSFILNLNNFSSISMENNAATDLLLSPSQKYVLVFRENEGAGFASVDLNTKRVLNGDSLGPRNKIWRIKSKFTWATNSDVLNFVVNEHCNSYDDPNCRGNQVDRVVAKYEVSLDAATLRLSSRRINSR